MPEHLWVKEYTRGEQVDFPLAKKGREGLTVPSHTLKCFLVSQDGNFGVDLEYRIGMKLVAAKDDLCFVTPLKRIRLPV